MSLVDEALAGAFRDVMGFAEPISDDLAAEVVPGWDSLAHLSLMEELERRLDVRFRVEEMTELTSVGLIRSALVRRRVGDDGE